MFNESESETGSLVMSDWIVVLSIVGGAILLGALVHGILRYRRLMREEERQALPVMNLSFAVWRQARKIVILLLGGSVMLIGVILLFLPGPGTVVIPLGLGILAIEFTWARRWLRRLRVTLHLSAKRSRRFFRRKSRGVADETLKS